MSCWGKIFYYLFTSFEKASEEEAPVQDPSHCESILEKLPKGEGL